MSGITSRVLQDISLSLPQKGIQLSSSRLHSTPSSRRFWSFFEFSRKENVPPDLEKIPLSTNSVSPSLVAPRKARNASEPTVSSGTTSMPSAVSLSAKRPCFSFTTKIPQNSGSKLSESCLESDSLVSFLDDNVGPRKMKWRFQSYKTLRHENAGDFAFLPNPANSQKQDFLPGRKDQSKSIPEERQLFSLKSPNQIKQEMSLFGSWALQGPSKSLVRSQTVTKFDVTKTGKRSAVSINDFCPNSCGRSYPGRSESQLSPVKPTVNNRASRLPVRIVKASIIPQNPVFEIQQQLLAEALAINRASVCYQCAKKGVAAPEVPTPLRLQPHPRGSAASRSGTVGFGQPLAGNSGDGGSRKPPAFPRPPITSSDHASPTRGNGDPWLKKSATISMTGIVNYSTKKSCGRNSKEDNAKPAKKPKQKKEECKRYCCPSLMDDMDCEIKDCSKSTEDNDCWRPPRKRASCSPPKKEKCGSYSSYTPPPPSTKKSSPCRSPSPPPSDCTTRAGHTGDYKYRVCCQDDSRDRLRNYQVSCPDEGTTKRQTKRSETKCPPQPMDGQEICTKPPPDDCRPTKCPEPKNPCGNQNRRYSQLASDQGNSSLTGGTRHFSTLSCVHSTSTARRLVAELVLRRSFASDPCKPKKEDPCKPKTVVDPCKPKTVDPCKPKTVDPCKPKTVDPCKPKKVDPCKPAEKPKKKLKLCKPPERPKEDPCKPVAKAKQPILCKPVICDTKKSKPKPKCLPIDQVSVLKKKPSNSCSPSEKKSAPKKSKSDEYCVDKGTKGGESASVRAAREKKEADACKTKKKKEDSKKDPCKPFASLDPKKQGDGLQRVISPCKQKQLSKKAEEKGNSTCSKFTLAPDFLSLPFHYFNSTDNLLATHVDSSFLPNQSLSTTQQIPFNLSSDRSKDFDKPSSFIDIFNDEEVQEAPELIPIESEEEDE